MKTTPIYTSIAIGVLCSLLCLLSSCEKELVGEGSGRKVAVNISLNSSGFVDATRSSVAQTPKSETTFIPLDDGLYINATLTEEPIDELRAAVNLVEGQRVRMAAFRNTTSTQESTADYVYSGGKLNPVSAPLMVEEDAWYNIVAYSYFNETAIYPPTTNTSSDRQLLWGTSGQKYITATDATISITMVQKYAQAKVSISTANLTGTPNITAVSGVTITSGGNRRNLSVWDGTLSAGTSQAQAVSFPTFTPSSTVTSNYRMIYPVTAGVQTILTIGSLTVDGFPNPYTNRAFPLTQAFLEGHSYVLTLDLKEVLFAGSNIYWDGTQLTFEPHGSATKSFYQGVYFKWGSMIGMPGNEVAINSSTKIYYPTGANTWSTNATLSSLYTNFENIPHMDYALATSHGTGIATDYVTNGYRLDNGGEDFNYTDKLGDICRRINPDYRLPRAEEFISSAARISYSWGSVSEAAGWYKGRDASNNPITFPSATIAATTNEDGTSVIDYDNFGAGFGTYLGVIFPAAGYRSSTKLYNLGTYGYYLCSGSYSVNGYYRLTLYNGAVQVNDDLISWGNSVRCVKN
jgi:hypothetical protein